MSAGKRSLEERRVSAAASVVAAQAPAHDGCSDGLQSSSGHMSLQKELTEQVSRLNQAQEEMQRLVRTRQQLEGQLTENSIVKEVRVMQRKGRSDMGRPCV